MYAEPPRRQGQPGDRRGPRQAEGRLERWSNRSSAATRSPRSTPARSTRTGPTSASGHSARSCRKAPRRRRRPIACWAWGIHRAVDYLTTDKDEIDPKRMVAVGHSRLGKTALLAAAFDDRIALAIPHQAGLRRHGPEPPDGPKARVGASGSTPASRTGSTADFKEFNDDPARLPFDQNCLVALCAPRPVLFTNAAEDLWANPDGPVRGAEGGRPRVPLARRRRAGREGRSAGAGKLVDSRLGYFIRAGQALDDAGGLAGVLGLRRQTAPHPVATRRRPWTAR